MHGRHPAAAAAASAANGLLAAVMQVSPMTDMVSVHIVGMLLGGRVRAAQCIPPSDLERALVAEGMPPLGNGQFRLSMELLPLRWPCRWP